MARGPLHPLSGVISIGDESWFSPPPTYGDELTASSASVETKSWVWWWGGGVGVGGGIVVGVNSSHEYGFILIMGRLGWVICLSWPYWVR